MSLFIVLGWLGNACFFSRAFVQWVQSERLRRSASPPAYWWMSLMGSILLGSYAVYRSEYVLLVGFAINGGIYARNLVLPRADRRRIGRGTRVLLLAVLAYGALLFAGWVRMRVDANLAPAWMLCALVGQAVWSSRFVVQWHASEVSGESHFPPRFWWISLAGNTLLLAYALYLRDPVFIAGYILGPFVQVRNLMLDHRAEAAAAAQ